MAGPWFGQFEVGRVFDHEIRRTVTEADNVWFNGATCNPAAIHIDAGYCKEVVTCLRQALMLEQPAST